MGISEHSPNVWGDSIASYLSTSWTADWYGRYDNQSDSLRIINGNILCYM